jgi:hypothetical protein
VPQKQADPRKRSEEQRLADMVEIAKRYLKGESQAAIALTLGCSQKSVSNDLKLIRAAWKKEAADYFSAYVEQELAKLDLVEQHYWIGWERSLQPVGKQTTVTGPSLEDDRYAAGAKAKLLLSKSGAKLPPNPISTTITVQTNENMGNPVWLQGVQWCIDRRLKLMGADAPIKIAPTNPEGTKEYTAGGITDSERRKKLIDLIVTAGVAAAQDGD